MMRNILSLIKRRGKIDETNDILSNLGRAGALSIGISYIVKNAMDFKKSFSEFVLMDKKHYPISGERFPTSQHCLHALSMIIQPESYLEIGTRYGYSLGAVVLGSNRISKAVSVDIDTPFDKVKENINSLGKIMTLELIQSDSRDFDTEEQFDLCYIDGDHSCETALHDIKKFWKNVKNGGVMAFDDTIRKRVDGSIADVYVLEASIEFLKSAENVESYFLQYPSFSGFGLITKKIMD